MASKPKMKRMRGRSSHPSRCWLCEKSVSPRTSTLRKQPCKQTYRARSTSRAAFSCEGRLPERLMTLRISPVLARHDQRVVTPDAVVGDVRALLALAGGR